MKKSKKTQIVKVKVTNITKKRKALKAKLDKIDDSVDKKVVDGFYESRLAIKIAMWKKGKVVASYFTPLKYEKVKIKYAELSRETGRNDKSLKQWHMLYENNKNFNDYRKLAELEAREWTEKALDKFKSPLLLPEPEPEDESKLPRESKAKKEARRLVMNSIGWLVDSIRDFTNKYQYSDLGNSDELDELRNLIDKIKKEYKRKSGEKR